MEPYPFLYYGHGCAYSRKCLEVLIAFDTDVPAAKKKAIAASIPEPLNMLVTWGPRWLHCGSDDTYEGGVKMAVDAEAAAYQKVIWDDPNVDWSAVDFSKLEATAEDFDKYEILLEEWIRAVHDKQPVALFFKPTNPSMYGDDFGPWHDWTVSQPDRIRAILDAADNGETEVAWAREILLG